MYGVIYFENNKTYPATKQDGELWQFPTVEGADELAQAIDDSSNEVEARTISLEGVNE